MAGTVYTLLVGINTYDGLMKPLKGCVNDIERFAQFLRERVPPGQLQPLALLDGAATREAVIDGLRTHLTKAGPGDVAVFCFAGHGARERTRPEFWFREPDGWNSTLVCVDSRTPGRQAWDLADKELGALLDVVAAGGPHLLVVLDCCHSGGGTRGDVVEEAEAAEAQLASGPVIGVTREVDPIDGQRPLETYVTELSELAVAPGTRDAGARPGAGRHVALFACESFQKARELQIGDIPRGVFSVALEAAITRLGPDATYRDLMVSVRTRVTDQVRDQFPVLFASDARDAMLTVLGGQLTPSAGSFTLVHGAAGWVIDAGACHGVDHPAGDETTVLAVLGPAGEADERKVLGTVRVVAVSAGSATVEPDADATLDENVQYAVLVVGTPLPAADVVINGEVGAVAAVARRIAMSGPGGTPSPHVRVVAEHAGDGTQLDVVGGANGYRISRPDGSRVCADAPPGEDGAARVVNRLEHIARWHQIRRLENPRSPLAGKVHLWLATGGHEEMAPVDIDALRSRRVQPDDNGVIRLSYERRDVDAHPDVFVVVENTAVRDLYITVIDLTDRFKMTPDLGDGWLPRGRPFIGWAGFAAPVTIPDERLDAAINGGRPAIVKDWIKVVAAEERFDPDSFVLSPLDEPIDTTRGGRPHDQSTIGRIARMALTRDRPGARAPGALADWTTVMVEVVTQLPAAGAHRS